MKKVKPEAEIFDIGTKKKVGEEGIMTLKSEIGLPKGVEPGSLADRAIQESAQYKMNQQGVKSLLDENYKAPQIVTGKPISDFKVIIPSSPTFFFVPISNISASGFTSFTVSICSVIPCCFFLASLSFFKFA